MAFDPRRCGKCYKREEVRGLGVCWECRAEYIAWIRNRPTLVGCNSDYLHFTTVMHAGFLCIYETEEELERLRRPEREEHRNRLGPAVSKIETTNLAEIQPINRVAARVVPKEENV